MARMLLGGTAAVLIALLAGFIWGASGRSAAEAARDRAQLRSDLIEARGAVLSARVALYNTNFGDASRHLEDAKALVGRASGKLGALGWTDDVKQLESAQAPIQEAQQLAGRLDLAANSRAADAVAALDATLQSTAGR